jgi:hypothetical protein
MRNVTKYDSFFMLRLLHFCYIIIIDIMDILTLYIYYIHAYIEKIYICI